MNLLDFKNSRKANINGPLLIIMSIFFLAFSSILTVLVLTTMRTTLTTAGVYTGAVATTFQKYIDSAVLMDNVLVFIMIAFFILLILTTLKVSANPVFFVASLVSVLFMGFISYFFNYVFIKLVSQPIFNTVLVSFPKSMVICTNLHWVALLAFVVGSITLYGKKPKGQFVQ